MESSGVAPRVVVVGDLLYDLLAKVEGEVIFGTDTFVPIRVAAGGSGANARPGSPPPESRPISSAGSGMTLRGVPGTGTGAGRRGPHLRRDPSCATGKVFVLVDGAGERTMITDRGAGRPSAPKTSQDHSSVEDICTSPATPSRAAAAGRPRERPCAWRASPDESRSTPRPSHCFGTLVPGAS